MARLTVDAPTWGLEEELRIATEKDTPPAVLQRQAEALEIRLTQGFAILQDAEDKGLDVDDALTKFKVMLKVYEITCDACREVETRAWEDVALALLAMHLHRCPPGLAVRLESGVRVTDVARYIGSRAPDLSRLRATNDALGRERWLRHARVVLEALEDTHLLQADSGKSTEVDAKGAGKSEQRILERADLVR
jgi:hypothetical protein